MDNSASRPVISHPYPPSYRSDVAQQNRSQQNIHQDYTPSYPPVKGNPFSDPSYQNTNPTQFNPISQSEYPRSPSPPDKNRFRSNSTSALAPALAEKKPKRKRKDRYKEDLPVGWDKEDEEAEVAFMKKGMVDWKTLLNWRFWIRKEWIWWYVALIIISVLVILMTVYHDQIVDWLTPAAKWMKALPAGWTIPIAIMFVLSFPPLFGQEIVAILCGVVWGLWIGFAIVAAGTFIGEMGNYYAFRYCLRSRAEKYEKQNQHYGCLAHVMREGGFFIVFMARLSAIPGHFTTAVFATCGMKLWVFVLATFLSLPKQMITVYLGVVLVSEGQSKNDKIISRTVLALTFLITVFAAWYIYHEMHKARVFVWRRQRAAEKGLKMQALAPGDSSIHYDEAYKEFPVQAIEDDARTPLNADTAYVNPYDSPSNGFDHRRSEEYGLGNTESTMELVNRQQDGDISSQSYAAAHYRPSNATQSFPHAQPAPNLRREPSSAPTVYSRSDYIPDHTKFPVPVPAPADQQQLSGRKEGRSNAGQGVTLTDRGYTPR